MDRFIDLFNYRPTRKFLYLKSNMDRFIAIEISPLATGGGYLKSNMDRFIVCQLPVYEISSLHLKSNMDRFIAQSE